MSAGGEITVFEAVGGMPFFERLVDGFYRRVAADESLLGLYPDQTDLGPARERLTLFLAQYWGGPSTYSDARGHPRLRMRHAPFVIDASARDRWLAAMRGSLEETGLPSELRSQLDAYFDMAADAMVNQGG